MKIALLSTPWISLPPLGYGGTERVVYQLSQGLVQKGHEVTVHTTGNSTISAQKSFFFQKALGNNSFTKQNQLLMLAHLYTFFKKLHQQQYDIIHNNAGDAAYYFLDLQNTPFVHTLHGTNISNELLDVYAQFKQHPTVSISHYQRTFFPHVHFVGNVYNAVELNEYTFDENGGSYITWLGRVIQTKGVDKVIEVAQKMKKVLKMSAFVDKGEQVYFDTVIKPIVKGPDTHILPEVHDIHEKSSLLKNARLFLFPIQWDEPFGLVMIESMATGTPVVAFARGSVQEVVKDGETGFIINPSDDDIRGNFIIKKTGIEGLCEAVERIYAMPADQYRTMRQAARQHVENNFTVSRMVEGYEKAYQQVSGKA